MGLRADKGAGTGGAGGLASTSIPPLPSSSCTPWNRKHWHPAQPHSSRHRLFYTWTDLNQLFSIYYPPNAQPAPAVPKAVGKMKKWDAVPPLLHTCNIRNM